MTNEWLKIRDKINEAEQHIKQLEGVLERCEYLCKAYPNENETFQKDVESLKFAIDFIKWGMK